MKPLTSVPSIGENKLPQPSSLRRDRGAVHGKARLEAQPRVARLLVAVALRGDLVALLRGVVPEQSARHQAPQVRLDLPVVQPRPEPL